MKIIINIAIIGMGNIVMEALPVIQQNKDYNVVALYARPHSREKGQMLVDQYGIGKLYTDYNKLLSDEEIDFVYLAVANIAHFDMCVQALQAGKHVIVEKPICPSAKDVEYLYRIAYEKKLYLFEAVTLLHSPNYQFIKDNLHRIGNVKLIQCNYSQFSSRYVRYLNHDVAPAFNPELKGGALYDINIYNINFVVSLFGQPLECTYFANKGYNGVDTSGTAILRYEGFIAQCCGAKDSSSPNYCTIQGESGWLRVNGSPNEFRNIEMQIGQEHISYDEEQNISRLSDEFNHFAKIYSQKDYEGMLEYLDISVNVAKTVDYLLDYR